MSVIVALVLTTQVGVHAQNPPVGPGGSGEIPVSGSELQGQVAKNTKNVADSPAETPETQSSNLPPLSTGPKYTVIRTNTLIPNLLFIGLIFWGGMKFGEYRARTKQQSAKK